MISIIIIIITVLLTVRRVEEVLQLTWSLVTHFVFIRLQRHVEPVEIFHEACFGRHLLLIFLYRLSPSKIVNIYESEIVKEWIGLSSNENDVCNFKRPLRNITIGI